MIENTVVLSMNAPFDFYFVSVFCFCQLYSMLIGLIKWSCTVQASELPVRASQLIAFDAGHAGLSFLPQSPRMICHPRVILCGRPQTHKNMLAASSVGLRRAATRPACNLTNDHFRQYAEWQDLLAKLSGSACQCWFSLVSHYH